MINKSLDLKKETFEIIWKWRRYLDLRKSCKSLL